MGKNRIIKNTPNIIAISKFNNVIVTIKIPSCRLVPIIDIKVLFKIENSTNSVNKFVEFIVRIPGNNIVVKSTAISFKESISNNVKSVERILKRKKLNFS